MNIIKRVIILLIVCVVLAVSKTPNPYKVLGISREATDDQIKKAFNKRSRKYHPDRNKQDPRAKQKFEKVVNAYELLKDPERRRMYDMTGSDDPQGMNMGGGFGGGAGGFGINMDDLFNMGFGGMGGGYDGFGGQAGGGRRGQRQRGRGGQRTYTFSFGGGGGEGFRFDL